MPNILWIQPNQTLALTSIIIEDVNPEQHAIELQEREDIPADWVIAAYNVEWPNYDYPHEAYRWVDNKIVVDENYVLPTPLHPTREQLLAQLQALQAQIESLV